MQAIILIGLQASGKSTFYKEYFFNSHMRISMDLFNTRNKETKFFDQCLELQQRLVVDNTNPTKDERQRYIEKLKARKYEIIGYYFQSQIKDSLARNALRKGKAKVAEKGILATYKKLELPQKEEGFDQLFYVEIADGEFIINPWNDEV